MQTNCAKADVYEYAVIRLVPSVERGESINIGVILHCRRQRFLNVIFCLNQTRIKALFPLLDMDELEKHVEAYKQICSGGNNAGPIGLLEAEQRFRWLNARRSTILQPSPTHVGITDNAAHSLQRIFTQMVVV